MLSELLKDLKLGIGTFLLRRYKRKGGSKYTYTHGKLQIPGYWLPHQIELTVDDLASTPIEITVNMGYDSTTWSVSIAATPGLHTNSGKWCRYEYGREYGIEIGVRIMLRLEPGFDLMTPILRHYE